MSDQPSLALIQRTAERTARLLQLMNEFPTLVEGEPEGVPARWVLVERSLRSGDYWMSYHCSPLTAASYHDTQESPGEWPVVALVDLWTGQRYEGETAYRTTWVGLQ